MLKWAIFNAVLFYVCIPGVVTTLGGKYSAIVHAMIFVVSHHLLSRIVAREFFDNPNTNVPDKCPAGYKNTNGGDCVSSTDVANAYK